MKVRQFYPVTLSIDGEDVALRVKRMTMDEHAEFIGRGVRVGVPTYVRFVSRESSGPEQEQDEKGCYAIPFEELAERKLLELSPDKRSEFEEASAADEAYAKEFLTWVFEQFVTVEKGLVEELPDGSEKSITAGLDFLRVFGARSDVLHRVLGAVRKENELDATQKKSWRSLLDSSPSSNGRDQALAGQKRETTASPVGTEDSADSAVATKKQQDRSGSMDPTPSDPVRSSH